MINGDFHADLAGYDNDREENVKRNGTQEESIILCKFCLSGKNPDQQNCEWTENERNDSRCDTGNLIDIIVKCTNLFDSFCDYNRLFDLGVLK